MPGTSRLDKLMEEWEEIMELKIPVINIIPLEERKIAKLDLSRLNLPPSSNGNSARISVHSASTTKAESYRIESEPTLAVGSARLSGNATLTAKDESYQSPRGTKTPQKVVEGPKSPEPISSVREGEIQRNRLESARAHVAQSPRDRIATPQTFERPISPEPLSVGREPEARRPSVFEIEERPTVVDSRRESVSTLIQGIRDRSQRKEELREGAVSRHVIGQLRGLQKTIDVRRTREESMKALINTFVVGGTLFMRLEDGKSLQCLVGVAEEAGTLWWDRLSKITIANLSSISRIEWGMDSTCFKLLQKPMHRSNSSFQNVLPWDCFSIIFTNREPVHLFPDRRKTAIVRTSPVSGKRSVVDNFSLHQNDPLRNPSPLRVAEADNDVVLFIYGLSLFLARATRRVLPGSVVSWTQLRFKRALIKKAYIDSLTDPQSESQAQYSPEPVIAVETKRPEDDITEAKARLKPWEIVLPATTTRRMEALRETVQARKRREDILYCSIEKKVLGGSYFMKIDAEGKQVPCLVGIGGDDSVTFWWEHGGQVTAIPLGQIEGVEWGLNSTCYKLVQKSKSSDLLNVLPWNCFTVFLASVGAVNLFADRRQRYTVKTDRKTGKRQLTTVRSADTLKREPVLIESAKRVVEVDEDVEMFLLGLAVLFRQQRSKRAALRMLRFVPGLPASLAQLKLRRAIMKMKYINHLTADVLADIVAADVN